MIDYENLRLFHRHGSDWGELRPREAHDPAEHDPERSFGQRPRLFRCLRCDEEVMVVAGDPEAEEPAPR